MNPTNPVAAVVHPDPYPYYADLVAGSPAGDIFSHLIRMNDGADLLGFDAAEVSRFDPKVQNTRRFVFEPTSIAGIELNPGTPILVVLAAAGRDPSANSDSDQFLLDRENRRTFGFGSGVHACPGQASACAIATAAIEELLAVLPALPGTNIDWTYRPSANGRIPLFSQ